MPVQISREPDGRVSLSLKDDRDKRTIAVSPVEARLIAIKLLLAAEDMVTR